MDEVESAEALDLVVVAEADEAGDVGEGEGEGEGVDVEDVVEGTGLRT